MVVDACGIVVDAKLAFVAFGIDLRAKIHRFAPFRPRVG